ncbi:MAG: methionine--tRNA ligase [Desulfobacteraceae bacterium]
MDTNRRFFTTPIYYVNAKPHLGHAYTSIITDIAARFNRMSGNETRFLTGTDEHGDKIVQAAAERNTTPKEYADQISTLFKELLPFLNISNDDFVRTTEPRHIEVVQKILSKIYESGDIYFSSYEGLYCFGCERFYQERELVDGKCPDHDKPPEKIKESNYFFAMSKYQDWLVNHIKTNPDFIRPERYRNELLSFLKEPLEDLCISRPKSRLEWGITLPFDENYVTYVWFDALVNYVSALGYPDGGLFNRFWPQTEHFVAKDIIKPHGIYWPTMLKAAGMDIFLHLNVHGFWNVQGSKMSKSIGNVTDPVEITRQYGLDPFRYFLAREMVFGLDANFTEDILVERINSDLSNDFGNLVSRVLSMTHRYFKGNVPAPEPGTETEKNLSLGKTALETVNRFETHMKQIEYHKATACIWEFVGIMNKYIDEHAPWALAKNDSMRPALETVMFNLIKGIETVSCLIYPIMPGTSEKMQDILKIKAGNKNRCPKLEALKQWDTGRTGYTVEKPPVLFPRIDTEKIQQKKSKPKNQAAPAGGEDKKTQITYDEFSRLDLRTGTVIEAEKIEKSNKLLKLKVDLGLEKRQVIAGIAKSYAPEQILGKQVIIAANLKPAKLMGELSEGMILAANCEDGLFLATFDRKVEPGNPVK